ncbi:type IV secretion system protein [Thalassotalea fusca]
MNSLNFEELEKSIVTNIDAAITDSLANIFSQGYEYFTPVFVFYITLLGIAIWRGAVEASMKEFIRHVFTLFIIFSLGLNAFGYTYWVHGVFTETPMNLIQTVIPGFQSIPHLLDNQATKIIQLNDKITDANNMFLGIFLSGVNTALALTYAVTIFAIYLMAKVVTGVLLSFGPLMFLSLLSDKTKGWFERWFIQLISFQMVFMLIVAYLAIFGNLVDNNLNSLKVDAESYRMKELAPMWGLILLMVIGAKNIKEMAASIAGGMSLSATSSISGMANYSRASLQQGINMGRSAGRSIMGAAGRFRGIDSNQANEVRR